VVYIESSAFTGGLQSLAGASAPDALRAIQDDLLKNPARGKVVQGLGGIRKERCPNPARAKEKRGGYRYLFLYLEHRDHIHLLYLLDKDEQEDLSNDERRLLRTMAIKIKETEQGQCDEEHYQEKQSQNIRGPEAVASGCLGLRAGQEERIASNRVAAEAETAESRPDPGHPAVVST